MIDNRIGVIGYGEKGAREMLFIQTYTEDTTLLTFGKPLGHASQERRKLQQAGSPC